MVTRLSSVEPEALEWLWPGRVPLGKVTLLVGDPGRGKSLLTLDMAARVTRGKGWPDAPEQPVTVGNVVMLSAEDDLADTIRPRLDAAGADAARVVHVGGVRCPRLRAERGFNLATDLAALERAIAETGGARLVVFDPLSAYLGGTDSHNNAEVRAVLAPLQALAERTGAAVVAVSHLNKSAGAATLYRTMGSLAFVAAARAVWAILPDEEAPPRMLLVPVKNNLAGRVPGLAYRTVEGPDDNGVAVLAWEPGPVMLSADELLGAADPAEERSRTATEWLREALADGPVPAADLERRAKEAGLGRKALARAKRALRVVSEASGFGQHWLCRLPKEERTLWGGAEAVPPLLPPEAGQGGGGS